VAKEKDYENKVLFDFPPSPQCEFGRFTDTTGSVQETSQRSFN
jgi:hypothetical protein